MWLKLTLYVYCITLSSQKVLKICTCPLCYRWENWGLEGYFWWSLKQCWRWKSIQIIVPENKQWIFSSGKREEKGCFLKGSGRIYRYKIKTIIKYESSWERLGAGEGDNRGWDGWMASLTRWTWVWVNSGSWWWTGRPGVLWFMRSQRVRHDWTIELNW